MTHFLTGLITGLAVAYLTAPQSGKQTRDMLTGFAKEEAEGIRIIQKAASRVEDVIEQAKS